MSPTPNRLLRLSAVLGLALTACGEPGDAPDFDLQADALAFNATHVPTTSSAGMNPWDAQIVTNRVIRRLPLGNSACTTASGSSWSASALFPGTTSPELQRYCILAWSGAGSPSSPPGSPASIVNDRLAVVGLSTGSDYADNAIDLVDPVEEFTSSFSKRTRLVLLDTLPTSDAPLSLSPTDEHGLRLAMLADTFVCDQDTVTPECGADVTSQLLLGWKRTGTPAVGFWAAPSNGGSIGRVSDVATAIVQAVDDWEADRASDPTIGRLVINLSLGWHPYTYPGSGLSAAEEAVVAALGYASCHDALVVSAAGHEDTPMGEPDRKGAAFPAAWVTRDEPSNAQCVNRFGGVSRVARTTSVRPLVHAVSVVNGDLRPSGFSRPGSVPALVAPGEFMVAHPPGGGAYKQPITGTSVSTVVASSAASVVWSLRPGDSPHDVMEQLHTSGLTPNHPTTVHAQVYNGPIAPVAKVVNVCKAAQAACAGGCTGGGVAGTCETSSVPSVTTPQAANPFMAVSVGNDDFCHGTSGPKYFFDVDLNASYDCPIQQNESASALGVVLPMPTDQPCLHCPARMLSGIEHVEIHLEPTTTFADLGNLTLSVHFGPGVQSEHYPIETLAGTFPSPHDGYIDMPLGSGVAASPGGGGGTVPAVAVTMSWTDAQGYSFTQPLNLEY